MIGVHPARERGASANILLRFEIARRVAADLRFDLVHITAFTDSVTPWTTRCGVPLDANRSLGVASPVHTMEKTHDLRSTVLDVRGVRGHILPEARHALGSVQRMSIGKGEVVVHVGLVHVVEVTGFADVSVLAGAPAALRGVSIPPLRAVRSGAEPATGAACDLDAKRDSFHKPVPVVVSEKDLEHALGVVKRPVAYGGDRGGGIAAADGVEVFRKGRPAEQRLAAFLAEPEAGDECRRVPGHAAGATGEDMAGARPGYLLPLHDLEEGEELVCRVHLAPSEGHVRDRSEMASEG